MPSALYVEMRVRAEMEQLWRLSQEPDQHVRWDLRFTEIDHLPRASEQEPQQFRYAVRPAPRVAARFAPRLASRLAVAGTGTTLGERHRSDGTRTSALGFGSTHPCSPILEGRGYWRYVPTDDGIRFLTGYDYTPRWGHAGRLVDRAVLRPAMGWATAWSFDRLRLWLETGQSPERSRTLALADVAARTGAVALAVSATRQAGGPRVAALAVAAAATVVAAAVPAPPRVPRAGRCLRRSPDRLGLTPPDTLNAVTSTP